MNKKTKGWLIGLSVLSGVASTSAIVFPVLQATHVLNKCKSNGNINPNQIQKIENFYGQALDLKVLTDGTAFVSTDTGFVEHIDKSGNVIKQYSLGAVVKTLLVDKNKDVFAGGYDNYIYKLNKTTDIFDKIVNVNSPVHNLATDIDGNIIVATNSGIVYKFKDDNLTQIADVKIQIEALVIDNENNVYVGTDDKNIYKIDEKGNTTSIFKDSQRAIYSLIQLKDGSLLAGTTGGKIYKSNTNKTDFKEQSAVEGRIHSLFETKNGSILIGTDGGIGNPNASKQGFLYSLKENNNKVKQIKEFDGVIYKITDFNNKTTIAVGDGTVWTI